MYGNLRLLSLFLPGHSHVAVGIQSLSLRCLHSVSRISAVPPLHLYLTLAISAVLLYLAIPCPRDRGTTSGTTVPISPISTWTFHSATLAYSHTRSTTTLRSHRGTVAVRHIHSGHIRAPPLVSFADYPSTHQSDNLEALGHFVSRSLTHKAI